MSRQLSDHDKRELDAFQRYLHISAWREKELGEPWPKSSIGASLEVYGDKFCEGNKHHDGHE